jgi:hypothetical protein
MSPKQKKLAAKAPPPNKIDAKDFAVLKAEKAKGRGMGLQDEKIKPGKVMKANKGRFSKIPLAGKATSVGSTTMEGMKFSDKAKMVDAGKINKATGKFTSMEALRESIGYRPGESTDKFNKRRMALAAAKKAAKASTFGKIALGVGAAGVAASQYLKSKMKKEDKKMTGGMAKKYSKGGGLDMGGPKAKIMQYIRDKKDDGQRLTMRDKEFIKSVMPKKMGGGMMQKPMGYNTGGYKSKEDRKEAEKNIKQARSKEGLRSFLSDAPKINQPMRKERYMEGREARHSAFKKKLGRTAAGIASSLNPVTSSVRLIGKVMDKESKKRDFQKGDYGDISVKKMGGGMMQRPMGYKDGTKPGAGPLGGAGQAARGLGALGAAGRPSKQQTPGPSAGRPASQEQNKRKGPDLIVMMPVKEGPAKQNTTIKTVKIKNRMSGGMMKPMGYRSGTMVKARGCKLGRTRPTKIT